jgi:hypothetical protein
VLSCLRGHPWPSFNKGSHPRARKDAYNGDVPPRFAYWTILIDNAPTAFRARDAQELLPTFNQLKRTNKDVVLKWFARGRLWESQEQEREDFQRRRRAVERPREPREARGKDWRPGGAHQDPRARFDKKRRPKPEFDARGGDKRAVRDRDAGKPRFEDRQGKPRFEDRQGKPRFEDRHTKPRFEDRQGKPRFEDRHAKPRFDDRRGKPRFDDRNAKPQFKDRGQKPRFDDRTAKPRDENRRSGKPPFEQHHGKPRFNERGEGKPRFEQRQAKPRFDDRREGKPRDKSFGRDDRNAGPRAQAHRPKSKSHRRPDHRTPDAVPSHEKIRTKPREERRAQPERKEQEPPPRPPDRRTDAPEAPPKPEQIVIKPEPPERG